MTNRRQLLKGLCISAIAAPWYMRTSDAAQSKGKEELLFVQTAASVELGDGVLKLGGINPATIFFADRPERVVGHEPTEVFVDNWNVGDNNFGENPPNAALSILSGPEPQEIILELMNPRLTKGELIYDVKVLEGKQTVTGKVVSLFIDPIGRPRSATSIAGVHRRERRRVIRRATPGPGL